MANITARIKTATASQYGMPGYNGPASQPCSRTQAQTVKPASQLFGIIGVRYRPPHAGIEVSPGVWEFIREGDWVIDRPRGHFMICDKETFELFFSVKE